MTAAGKKNFFPEAVPRKRGLEALIGDDASPAGQDSRIHPATEHRAPAREETERAVLDAIEKNSKRGMSGIPTTTTRLPKSVMSKLKIISFLEKKKLLHLLADITTDFIEDYEKKNGCIISAEMFLTRGRRDGNETE